jgi:hypothetical protein
LHQVYHSYSYLEDAISILLGLHEQYELQYERDKPKKDLIKKSSGGKAIFLSNYFLIIEFHFFLLQVAVLKIFWQEKFKGSDDNNHFDSFSLLHVFLLCIFFLH